jgi:hypothetical protein
MQIASENPKLAKAPDLSKKLETARAIAMTIIDTMSGEALREKWEQLRKIFIEIESQSASNSGPDKNKKG